MQTLESSSDGLSGWILAAYMENLDWFLAAALAQSSPSHCGVLWIGLLYVSLLLKYIKKLFKDNNCQISQAEDFIFWGVKNNAEVLGPQNEFYISHVIYTVVQTFTNMPFKFGKSLFRQK